MTLDIAKVNQAVKHMAVLQARLKDLLAPVCNGQIADRSASTLAAELIAVRNLRQAITAVEEDVSAIDKNLCQKALPEAFEREGLTTFNLKAGYRVTVSQRYFASVIPEKRPEAHLWLRSNMLGDLIIETVNASTLSAAGKQMLSEGKELTEDYFRCYFQPNTSITKSK